MKRTQRRWILFAAIVGACASVLHGCSDSQGAVTTYDGPLDAASIAQQAPTLEMLRQMVEIESGTGDAIGMKQMGDFLEQQLVALGAVVTRHPAANGGVGDNIVGTFRGNGTSRLLLMAHMDTVYPRGTLAAHPYRVDGNKAYGLGIADDKSGIAVVLNAMALLNARGFRDYGTITVLFNTDEETGSNGSFALIRELSATHDNTLSHEPSPENELFTLASSGTAKATVRIKGVSSHAGNAPDAGVNALTEAADLILRSQDIDDKSREVRFNWTLATAGTASNVIPDTATISADMRYGNDTSFAAMSQMLNERAQRKRLAATQVEVDIQKGRPAYNADAGSRALATQAQAIYSEVGGTVGLHETRIGGGSDINFAAEAGKPSLERLGLPGNGFHNAPAEFIRIDAIPRRLYLEARMIMALSR